MKKLYTIVKLIKFPGRNPIQYGMEETSFGWFFDLPTAEKTLEDHFTNNNDEKSYAIISIYCKGRK
jgi:hypothetical protein